MRVFERWVDRLPKAERDMPLMVFKDKMYTPNQVLREIEAKTALGAEFQKEVDRLELQDDALERMVIPRIKKRLEEKPLDKPFVYFVSKEGSKQYYTPREIIEAVEKKTDEGKKHMEDERRYIRYLYGLR